ncbi:hypothetical protein G5C60_13960 [Streptomyces sp. HC44]|uniref:DUF6545 domain-containing protein n=1 Tax=Streptomyces scabichelini TaxID=2711217 RepID=A0A6G4V3V2_9ACTN|nr:DUF6545 domain-containing protein [Streptomyces scabichelini]NGO08686.1 hypothetical protein [Streptomyces scabichelini]
MSSGTVFYVPGFLLLLAAVLKLSAGRTLWRDPLVASTGVILLIGSLVCLLSAPPTIRFVNDVTGVANFSAPLVYAGLTALSAGYLVLMINWEGGPPERQRRASLLVMGFYGLVIAGIWVLFALADVPVERTRDLDTYYANTPYMREMILLYLVAHTAATVALMVMSVRWLREVRGVIRTGLTLIVVGLVFDGCYQIVKYAAMAARWQGINWDVLSTDVSPPLVMLAGTTCACGFALPRVGPPLVDNARAWRRYRLLKPLSAELRTLRAPATGVIRWWDPPVRRLARQEISIWDGVLACSPHLDDQVRATAYDAAVAAGSDPVRAQAEAEAAMLAAARVQASHRHGTGMPSTMGTLQSISTPHQMVGLSQALSSSPVVAEVRRQAALQAATSHD